LQKWLAALLSAVPTMQGSSFRGYNEPS
jgi:hypothetical protein